MLISNLHYLLVDLLLTIHCSSFSILSILKKRLKHGGRLVDNGLKLEFNSWICDVKKQG